MGIPSEQLLNFTDDYPHMTHEQGLGIPAESPRPRYSTFIAELRKKRDHRWRTLK